MSHFWLEVETDGHRQRFDFDQQTVSVGRDQSSDFHLDHPTVSRQHALFVQNQGQFQLVVLSQNGLTAVDGNRVQGTVGLQPGQMLQFGEIQLAFRTDQGATPFGEVATEMVSLDEVNPMSQTAAMAPVEENTAPSQMSMDRPPLALGSASDVQTDSMGAVGGPNPFHGQGHGQQQQQQQQQQHGFQQGFGQQQQQQPQQQQHQQHQQQQQQPSNGAAPPPQEDEDHNGIKSWDEIAAEAATGAHQAVPGGATDFERIQAAQAKARKNSKGTNPLLLVVLVAAVGGVGYLLFFDDAGPAPGIGEVEQTVPEWCEGRRICYPEAKVPKCSGPADCKSKAIAAYKVADELYKRKGANITNSYEAYKQLDKADHYLIQGQVTAPPPEMKDYKKRTDLLEAELDKTQKEYEIRYHQLGQRKMHWEMAEAVVAWQSFYTDKYNTWYDKAIAAERNMKDRGLWPKKFGKVH